MTENAFISDDNNPCMSCGACCAYFRVSFYFGELAGQSGGWVPVELTSKVNDFRVAMKGTEAGKSRCIALRGEVGYAGVSCSIYENRPSTCREFNAWQADGSPDPECQRLRALRGLPALRPQALY
ncbi:MAG TPA: YkgJ family cysteine cluster protein [Burkholderiaceae bacterium]|jgi:Fe-S-cluster containining protein|nr:YkgJ family cysteine cluster protein [Burkholderiaceae bacterium]